MAEPGYQSYSAQHSPGPSATVSVTVGGNTTLNVNMTGPQALELHNTLINPDGASPPTAKPPEPLPAGTSCNATVTTSGIPLPNGDGATGGIQVKNITGAACRRIGGVVRHAMTPN